jgi:hypothetical protein
VELTLYNYKTWCARTVSGVDVDSGTTPPAQAVTTTCVAHNAELGAKGFNAIFELGTPPSPFLSGVTDGGVLTDGATTSATVASTTETACVFVCCPFSGDGGHTAGSGCSGITNSCTDAATP